MGRFNKLFLVEEISANALRHEGAWHTGDLARDQAWLKHRLRGKWVVRKDT